MGKSTIDLDWLQRTFAARKAEFGGAVMTAVTPEPPAPAPTPTPTPPPAPASDEKQLPQSRVNEIVATETAKARDKALADLAADLGVSVEDAKRIVKERKESDDKNRTDLERETARAAAAEKERDEKTSAAAVELHAERSDRALVAAGVPDEDAKLERLRGMLTVKVGASKDDIKKDVEKLKADFPALFETSTTLPPRRVPSSDPQRKPGGTAVTTDAYQRGIDRAAARGTGPQAAKVEPLPIPGLT